VTNWMSCLTNVIYQSAVRNRTTESCLSSLSNFYKCSFALDGITYNCSEQFIQQKRCECLGQEAQAQRILATSDPSTQKRLSNPIRTDPTPWFDVDRSDIMPAIWAKFTKKPWSSYLSEEHWYPWSCWGYYWYLLVYRYVTQQHKYFKQFYVERKECDGISSDGG